MSGCVSRSKVQTFVKRDCFKFRMSKYLDRIMAMVISILLTTGTRCLGHSGAYSESIRIYQNSRLVLKLSYIYTYIRGTLYPLAQGTLWQIDLLSSVSCCPPLQAPFKLTLSQREWLWEGSGIIWDLNQAEHQVCHQAFVASISLRFRDY